MHLNTQTYFKNQTIVFLLNIDEYVKLQHDKKVYLSFFHQQLVKLDQIVGSCHVTSAAVRGVLTTEPCACSRFFLRD